MLVSRAWGRREKQHCDVTGSDSERCYGGTLLVLAKNLQHFSAMFYDSSASSQNEEWPKKTGQLWKLQSSGISLVCG